MEKVFLLFLAQNRGECSEKSLGSWTVRQQLLQINGRENSDFVKDTDERRKLLKKLKEKE